MKALRNTLLLTALAAVLSTNTAQAQLRLKQTRERIAVSDASNSQKRASGGRRNRRTTVSPTSSVGNNRALAKFDLTVTAVNGRDNGLMATVKNLGFTRTPASELRIVVKDRITGRTRISRTARVQPLDSGSVHRVRVNPISIGNSQVFVTVDPNGRIAEGNEQNNSRSATFAAPSTPSDPSQRADLHFTGLQPQGNLMTVQLTNMGRARSGATLLNVVVRRRDGRLQDTKSASVRPLNPGETSRLTIRNMVLNDVNVIVTVDPENVVPESNERNNTRQLTVGSQTQFAPDLTITDIMFKRDKNEVWFAVRNVGSVAQNQDVSLTVKSYFGPGNVVERTSMRVSRINTGQTIWHRWTVGRLNAGMQFEGVLDVSNRLPEQNENNNRRVETFN